MRPLTALLLLCALLASPARAQNPLAIRAESCFVGMEPRGVYPIVVTVRNQGPSIEGALQIVGETFGESPDRQRYPISLPTGTIKRLLVYPSLAPYTSQVTVSFLGPARVRPFELRLERETRGQNVGLIGDEVGALAAIRKRKEQKANEDVSDALSFGDCYARPEDAPDRAIGYQGLRALALGGGAERLNAAQWSAIRQWVLGGGSLLLLGGASAPALQLPDAQPLLPIPRPTAVTAPRLNLPASFFGHTIPAGRAALLTGPLKPGAVALEQQDGHPLLAALPVGAGMVIFAAFNPLEEPLRRHEDLNRIWVRLVQTTLPTVGAKSDSNPDSPFSYSMGGGMLAAGMPGAIRPEVRNDPFQIQLPPLTTIVWYFVAYFVLVVPVTYLVLRLARRLEWAWFVGPMISIGFACGLYFFTADLYHAGMSRRSYGLLLGAAGEREARFTGYSELFLPRAGSYPLQIAGAETVQRYENDYDSRYYYRHTNTSGQAEPLETVDTGTVEVPEFPVGNLAFRRVYHTQAVPLSGAITANLRQGSDGTIAGTIRNGTAWTLHNVTVRQTEQVFQPLKELKPGETYSLKREAEEKTTHLPDRDRSELLQLKRMQSASAFLTATIAGDPFGPPLGRDVGGDAAVRLIVSLPIAGGSR